MQYSALFFIDILDSNTESYVEYELSAEQESGVTILSSINDGQFQKVYVNLSPVEESELPGDTGAFLCDAL